MIPSHLTVRVSGGHSRMEVVVFGAAMFYSAMVGSHLLRAVMYPWIGRWGGVRMTIALAGLVLMLSGVLGQLLHIVSPSWLKGTPGPPVGWVILQYGYFLSIWTAVYLAAVFYGRVRAATEWRLQVEAIRREAELRALRARINPHFLFNSLNTLRALIPRELERPRTAVTLLADLLRASLRIEDQDLVSLVQEMENVDNYLALEQLRLGGRLKVVREIDTTEAGWRVPPFLLQGLVENAVRHGVARHEAGGTVVIRAREVDGMLQVLVTNPGELNPAEVDAGRSLTQARSRLQLLLGPAARLDVGAGTGGSGEVEARIVLPPLRPTWKGRAN